MCVFAAAETLQMKPHMYSCESTREHQQSACLVHWDCPDNSPSFVLRWRRFLTCSSALTHKVVTSDSWFSVFICGPNINQPSPNLTPVVLWDNLSHERVWCCGWWRSPMSHLWHLIPLPDRDKLCDFTLKIHDSVICFLPHTFNDHSFHLLFHHKLFSCITVNHWKEVKVVGRTKICLLK